MTKRLLLLFAAAALAVSLMLPATAEAAKRKKLVGTVGPGFTIVLKKKGHIVTSLKAGKYKIVIHDNSSSHNFHLTGPGDFDKSTDVGGTGTTTWKVRLKPGTYEFVCDLHASSMIGSFT